MRRRLLRLAVVGLVGVGCGGEGVPESVSRRELTGSTVAETGYPATGMLRLKKKGNLIGTCTATLVRADAAISAAHCGINEQGESVVESGELVLPSQTLQVRRFVVSDDYVTLRKDQKSGEDERPYDVAVILLMQPAKGVTPARLGTVEDLP